MISVVHSWFIYTVSLLLFFNRSRFLIMWLNIEINLLSFIYIIRGLLDRIEKYNAIFYYFLIQSLGRILFLFSSFFKFGSYWFSDLFYTFSLTLKLGIFPLYFWIINLGGSLKPMVLFLILSFQKIVIIIFLFSSNSYLLELVLAFSFIYGSFNLFFCNNLNSLLIMSSISSCVWIYFFYLNNFSFYLCYYLFYFIILLGCYTEARNSLDSSPEKLVSLFIFLRGFPPLLMFFLKFRASSFSYLNLDVRFCYLFLIFTFVGLFGYVNYFQKSFFLFNSVYLNNKKWFRKISKIAYSLIFFVYFML